MRDVGFLRGFFYLIQLVMILKRVHSHYVIHIDRLKTMMDLGLDFCLNDFCLDNDLSVFLPKALKKYDFIVNTSISSKKEWIWIGGNVNDNSVCSIIYEIIRLEKKHPLKGNFKPRSKGRKSEAFISGRYKLYKYSRIKNSVYIENQKGDKMIFSDDELNDAIKYLIASKGDRRIVE